MFDSVGFAIEDFAALSHTRRTVAGSDLVSWLDLVAVPADPKDLFALTTAPAGALVRT